MRKQIDGVKIALSLLLVSGCCLVWGQQSSTEQKPVDVEMCTQFKKDVYEEVRTFGFFIHGAQDMTVIEDSCKESTAAFIVGGSPAKPKEFPAMARLGFSDQGKPTNWFCGGTLISDRFVLTAAHCLFELDGEVNRVSLGALDFNNTLAEDQAEVFGVRRNISHPDYAIAFNHDDIGLIELDRPVRFNQYKHPACLPVTSGDEFTTFVATGWGNTGFTEGPSNLLLKVGLERFDTDYCNKLTDQQLSTESQICAGSKAAKDTCQGDSGGPLLVRHKDYPCMYSVVGVTSFAIAGCGTPNIPAIYTRVHHYIDWIRKIVWESK